MFRRAKKEHITDLEEFDKRIQASFKSVREEMDDHLTAINENTDEMQEQANHMTELESKVEKLKEQLDEVHMMLSQLTSQNKEYKLTDAEKNVFMVLYSVEQTPLSYSDIVMRTGLTELAVKAHIFSMINKGIPIVESKISNQSYFRLDRKFKELQANENILKIDAEVF